MAARVGGAPAIARSDCKFDRFREVTHMRLLTTAVLGVLLACRTSATPAPGAGWTRVDGKTLAGELAQPRDSSRLVIVDVREPELFRKAHLPGAVNLPYPGARERAPVELDPASDIVLVCHSGPMGDEVAAILAARHFRRVRNLAGGMRDWAGPLEPGS
jgi:rhodanese-related sulfurtransferase